MQEFRRVRSKVASPIRFNILKTYAENAITCIEGRRELKDRSQFAE